MTQSSWQVETTRATVGTGDRRGYSFSIKDSLGETLLTITYANEEDAKRAEEVVRKTIENAIDITKP